MMRPDRFRPLRNAFLAAIAAAPFALHAASGEFSFVVGEVSVVKANGQRITPVRGTPIDPGDRISTGPTGMVQLTMVDQARLSLRPNTQFVIEQYPQQAQSDQGGILNLVRGTLRTFTGLIASSNRDKFVMRTRVATVGIRGSGNILYACDGGADCDESVAAEAKSGEPLTVNHTIEGSHAITNNTEAAPGTPAQQGGASTLITGPGQTVLVAGFQPPRYIPTPRFIADVAVTMAGGGKAADASAASSSAASSETRNFSPGDTPAVALTTTTTTTTTTTAITPPPPNPTDATGNVGTDPLHLRDIVIVGGSPFLGQAVPSTVTTDATGNLQTYSLYPYAGTAGGLQPTISGGTVRDAQTVFVGGEAVSLGRWENAQLGFGGGLTPIPGSIHWVMANSGYPTYLSDVLTGVASYTMVAATSPTNQNNTVGTIGNAQLNANFTNRTMQFQATITIPQAGSNAGGTWQIGANNVPFSLNSFFGSTSDYLTISRGGTNSGSNTNLTGSFEGSFIGLGISGAILGYGISDRVDGNPSNWNFVSGVAVFQGPTQNGAAPYREGRVSDVDNQLADFVRSYATTDRPDEVTVNAQNQVTSFTAPYARAGMGPHSTYNVGTAQVVQSGIDPETGLVWGRWAGGTATVTQGTRTEQLFLQNASLHYVFAGTQTGPVALPQTGTATYDVIGSTSPTDAGGHVGTMNSATLNANFNQRTVDAVVNIGINSQTWNGNATGMPIYREQYFSAYSGTPIAGVPNPVPLIITCSPNCGAGATGSFDGFFTGRTGQGAGLLYNLGGNQGAIAFRRHGGG